MKSELINAIKNPPPARLAKIEYQSHFLQIIGITVVCAFLFLKGFWYIIFAFIFGVGVSYSQGMTAYAKYNMISGLQPKEKIEDFEKDISWTRRRGKIVDSQIKYAGFFATIVSVGLSVFIIDPTYSRWVLMVLYPVSLFVIYIFTYYYLFYWMAYPFYRKEVEQNDKSLL